MQLKFKNICVKIKKALGKLFEVFKAQYNMTTHTERTKDTITLGSKIQQNKENQRGK